MTDDERWSRDIATLRRAAEDLARRRNGLQKRRVVSPFEQIAQTLDDPSPQIRETAVRELYELDPHSWHGTDASGIGPRSGRLWSR